MLSLVIHKDAGADIAEIREDDPKTARRIAALVIELKGDQDLLDRLTQRDYGAHRTEKFHVDKWVMEQRNDRNLWRVKLWDLEDQGIKYRIIYAFQPELKRYAILAVAPRSFNYDEKHPLTQRIRIAYDAL